MAKQIQTTLVDDLDGTEGAETIKFGVDGSKYEIDLNKKHAETLRSVFEPFIKVARKIGSQVSNPNSNTKAIRAWAVAQNMTVPERGRLPPEIVEAYKAAHPEMANATPEATSEKKSEKKNGDKASSKKAA